MKIKKEFSPITIILETEADVWSLKFALDLAKQTTKAANEIELKEFLTTLSKFISE